MPFKKNKFPQLQKEAKKLVESLPAKIGVHLVNETKQRFQEQKDINGNSFAPRNPDFREGGAVLTQRGKLRDSVRYEVLSKSKVKILAGDNQEVKYAQIHNEGGEITVTKQMKKFHWAMENKFRGTPKGGFHKAMALKKEGSKINIPKREYLGFNNKTKQGIQALVKKNVTQTLNNLKF